MSQFVLFANTGENKYLMTEYMVFKPIIQFSPSTHSLCWGGPAFQDLICRKLTVWGRSLLYDRRMYFYFIFFLTGRWINVWLCLHPDFPFWYCETPFHLLVSTETWIVNGLCGNRFSRNCHQPNKQNQLVPFPMQQMLWAGWWATLTV